MDRNDIASLIEALCEAPRDAAAEPSAELMALRRKAASLLAEAGDNPDDADAQIAALAAFLSGSVSVAPRDTLAEFIPPSNSTRLDVESAAAFVESMEQSAAMAPADLVAEFSEPQAAAVPRPAAEKVRRPIAHGFRLARVSRLAAASAVIVVASAASWSVYWREHEQLAAPPASESKTESAAPAMAKTKSMETDAMKAEGAKRETTRPASVVAAPAPLAAPEPAPMAAVAPARKPEPALAARQPCEPKTQVVDALRMRRTALSAAEKDVEKAGGAPAAPGCDAAPTEDADAAIRKALGEAERARQNAAAPVNAAPAAAAVEPAQSEGGLAAQPADSSSGGAGRPATTTSTPAAKHPTRPRELSR